MIRLFVSLSIRPRLFTSAISSNEESSCSGYIFIVKTIYLFRSNYINSNSQSNPAVSSQNYSQLILTYLVSRQTTCHPHPIINPQIYNLSHLLTSILKSTLYLHTLSPFPLQKTTRQSNPIQLRSIYAAYKQYQTNSTTTLQPSPSHQTSSKKGPPRRT